MVTPELLDFIREGHDRGTSEEALLAMLLGEGGWNKEDVDEAFKSIFHAPVVAPPPPTLEPTLPTPPTVVKEPVILETERTEQERPLDVVTPTPTPTLALGEDFLGIFGSTSPTPKIEIIFNEENVPERVNERTFIVATKEEIKEVTRPTPQVFVPPTPRDTAPHIVDFVALAPLGETQVATETQKVAPLKFNFEKLRTASALGMTPTTPEVKTAGAENDKKETQVPLGAALPTTDAFPELKKVLPPVLVAVPSILSAPAQIAKSDTLLKTRTMASDMLLRGISDTAIPSVEKKTPIVVVPDATPAVLVKKEPSPPPVVSVSTLSKEIIKKNHTRRLMALAFAVLGALLGISALAFGWSRFSGPDIAQMFTLAQKSFFDQTAFGYGAQVTTALEISPISGGASMVNSTVNIGLTSSGNLLSGAAGYGDGVHHLVLDGGVTSGAVAWPTDIEVDVRMLGTVLYFQLLSFPATSNLDPELFRKYWVKVDLAEIAKELSLSGVAMAGGGYGDFGGEGAGTSFNALLQKNSPLSALALLPEEKIDGVPMHHLTLEADPEKSLQFISMLYRTYTGKDLVLDAGARVRFKDALKKIKGDAWINKSTGVLTRITLKVLLDDDVAGVHMRGSALMDVAINQISAPSTVTAPTPMLTLEELRVQMENYKVQRVLRARDKEKIDQMKLVTLALDLYYDTNGRFPSTLSALPLLGASASSTLSEEMRKSYTYAAYVSAAPLTYANRCTPKGKICAYYHIGTDLEEVGGPLLQDDDDITSEIRGSDARGCKGEQNLACYDLVGTRVAQPSSTTTPTPLPQRATSTIPKSP